MKTIIKLVLALVMLTGTAMASELSDYQYFVNHTDNPGTASALENMAFHYGGMDKLNARMAYISTQPVLVVNAYAKYNPMTGNVDWTGYWQTK